MKAPFPHCDSLVLHAPSTCEFCDMYPEAQQERVRQGINFTGENEPGKARCPAEKLRPAEQIHRWWGNRPSGNRSDLKNSS